MKRTQMLTILHNAGAVFTDYTLKLADFTRDAVVIALKTTEYVYVGFYKPINYLFVEMSVKNTVANALTLKYWNGTTWQPVTNFYDESQGLTRSGFINWSRFNDDTTQLKNTINGTELYWYQISCSVNHSATTAIMGLNLVFSNDNDLVAEFPEILNEKYLPENKSSHVLYHVAARNQIIQYLRNQGNVKVKDEGNSYATRTVLSNFHYENIDQWDILDVEEIREAAAYLALSKIFYNLSDKPEDYYAGKGSYYYGLYESAIKVYALTIDVDDDGKTADKENLAPNIFYMER